MTVLSFRGNSCLTFSLVILLISLGTPAQADTYFYTTPAGASTSGGSVHATADITVSLNTVTITLNNLGGNPTADSQLISGFSLNVSGATGSSVSTVNSGNISTISSGGSYTAGTSDALTRWDVTGSSTSVSLTTLSGGTPDRLIIGPDSKGYFDPTKGGLYSAANSSITGSHNPSVLGTATFTITDPGITATSTLSNVVFDFGTTAGSNMVMGTVPEPASVISVGLGLLCVAGAVVRRARRKRSA